jgi:hypothetical protein
MQVYIVVNLYLICADFFKIPFSACRCLFLQGVCFMGVERAVLVPEKSITPKQALVLSNARHCIDTSKQKRSK